MRKIPILTLLACCLLLSCDKKEEEPYNPWPVWIIYVHAWDESPNTPVLNCARVVWQISGSQEVNTTTCAELDPNIPNVVKVWQPIREQLTVIYHVECEGFINSIDYNVFFDPQLAYTRPGAPGDEVIEDVDIIMYRQ